MARVSVVIPTYNRANYLGKAIQSVLDQTFQDFEIIVVDDGSKDNTREVVGSFKDTRIRYIYQDNGGVSAARNTAIKASEAVYIAFLDSDDLYLPQNLEIKVKLLDSHPDIGMVCSDIYLFDNITGATDGRFWHDKKGAILFDPVRAEQQPIKELLCRRCFIGPPLTMIRREIFAAVGYFDESLPTSEDWDLFFRILQHFSIKTIDKPLVRIRRNNGNLTSNHEKTYLGTIAAINKAIHSDSLSGEELKLLKERLVLERSRYGRQALLGGREAAARKAMLATIRLEPCNIKLYLYVVLSFLGTKKILALRNWKKVIARHSVRSHSSGGTCYERGKLLSK
jgi:glycosyltransferase involved in cell wall biosynthesis